MPSSARFYIGIVALMFGLFVLAVVVDMEIIAAGKESMTDWLRAHPVWFWVPAISVMVIIAGLIIHLFVLPMLK
jgi:hypothetical protein